MKRKLVSLLMLGVITIGMITGCASDEVTTEDTEKKEDSYEIGVLQLIQHDALDAANEGFVAALDEAGISYTIDQQNASGDAATTNTIAEKFVTENKDLILAIGTPAAQAVYGKTEEIPIIGTAITDFADAKLVKSNEEPGYNVTGSSDLNPIDIQVELITDLVPNAKKIAVFFSADEPNSAFQAEMFTEAAKAANLEVIEYTISNSNEIDAVVRSMQGAVDACYIPTDNKLAAGMGTVSQAAIEIGLPVICGEGNMVLEGGLATYGLDYYELGVLAGEMAIEVLEDGKNPAEMPIQFLPTESFELIVNEETAKALNIDVSILDAE